MAVKINRLPKMKKTLLVFILSFIFVFSATVSVFAIEDSTSTINSKRSDVQEQVMQKKADVRERVATKEAEFRQKRVGIIKELLLKVVKRLSAAHERLDKISARIQSKIDKLKAEGVDVSSAQAALDLCDAKSAAVGAGITDATSKIDAIDPNSTSVKDQVKAAEASVRSAKRSVGAYHKCLVDSTKTLRILIGNREGAGNE